MDITFSMVDLTCNPNGYNSCGFIFEANGTVTIKNSKVSAPAIYFKSGIKDFQMDSDSILNATGIGNIKGSGYEDKYGASYAGQGGTQDPTPVDATYGSFDQVPEDDSTYLYQNLMGSGGGNAQLFTRGGGVVMIRTQNGTFNGRIEADGFPSSTKISTEYHAGSGGYVFLNCTDAL